VSPIGQLIASHGVDHHQYADDTQLFLAMRSSNIDSGMATLDNCSKAVKRWFAVNDLLLNADKSDFMFIGTSAQLAAAPVNDDVTVAGVSLPVSNEIKSLGVILDSRLTFNAHATAVCKAINYHIWALRHIRRLLPLEIAQTLACSIVGARLDYCNSVLYGAPKSTIIKLQRAQNSLARVVLQQPKCSHAGPLLQSLHWLPVAQRIDYKLAVLTYKVLSTAQPSYLHSLLSCRINSSTMSLRSSSRPLLELLRTRTVYGSRAFSASAPKIWNNLPINIINADSITSFRKRLKTFLFTAAYAN
jgi:hypothetical protein